MQNQNRRRTGLLLAPLVLLLQLLFVFFPVVAAAAAVATNANASDPILVDEDRWGPISTPVPRAAIEKFEAAVVGYASLRGEVVAPLEEVSACLGYQVHERLHNRSIGDSIKTGQAIMQFDRLISIISHHSVHQQFP